MELSRSNLPEAFPAGLFDTHTHYDDEKFDGVREELLCSLFERGLSGLIHLHKADKQFENQEK